MKADKTKEKKKKQTKRETGSFYIRPLGNTNLFAFFFVNPTLSLRKPPSQLVLVHIELILFHPHFGVILVDLDRHRAKT